MLNPEWMYIADTNMAIFKTPNTSHTQKSKAFAEPGLGEWMLTVYAINFNHSFLLQNDCSLRLLQRSLPQGGGLLPSLAVYHKQAEFPGYWCISISVQGPSGSSVTLLTSIISSFLKAPVKSTAKLCTIFHLP